MTACTVWLLSASACENDDVWENKSARQCRLGPVDGDLRPRRLDSRGAGAVDKFEIAVTDQVEATAPLLWCRW